jgi:GT2 family glycosyltransferase
MLTRRDVFQQIGGFDEALSHDLADIDLCLKMRRAGYLIVYTPLAKLYWNTLAREERDLTGEAIMRQRWSDVLEQDPYYNPNLARERADFAVGR